MAASEEQLEQPDLDEMFGRQSIATKAMNLMRKLGGVVLWANPCGRALWLH